MPSLPVSRVIAFAAFSVAITLLPTRAEIVAQWSFENDLLDTAASGATADHLSAVALTGPLSTVFVPGIVGQAVQVGEAAGDATVLTAPDSNDLDLASEFTVESFVYRTVDHGSEWERFATKWFDGSTQWHWAFRGPPGRSQDLFMNGGQQINQGNVSADISLGEWHHVAITGAPATGLRLWQDGVVVGSSAYVAPQNGTDSFRIGNAAAGQSALQFSGWVDEFQIHNVAQDATYMAGRTALILGGPAITTFTATPAVVASGEDSTLNWTVSDADTVTLDGGPFVNSDVTGQVMAIATNLTTNTTFTLTATNALGSTNAQITVGVGTAGAELFISEFLAINDGGLEDEDGASEDWIEICNPDAVPALLTGWYLTDDPLDLTKWQFPATTVPGLGYLVVFASGKDRIAGAELHTNFKLTGDGEYLALVMPDGTTIATEFEPAYPAQQSNVSYGFHGSPPVARSLFPPTPGDANTTPAGPIIRNLSENPDPVPGDNDAIVVSAEVTASPSPVTSVSLHYRVMFGSEILLPMTDSGGGVYRATIPASASAPGQMVRWRVTADSLDGNTSRAPLFHDPLNSPEYHGTVIADPAVSSQLPVMHRFLQNPAGTESRSGTRGAFFYNGEFYDNIFSRIRGGTSANWPKKSYKIEFNDGHHFRFRDGVPRVDEINLNTTYTDKSYVRSVLSYEHQRDAGLPSPEAFLVHLRQNDAFWNVAILIEQPDRDFLRRWELDPDGAFYKGAISPTHYEPSDSLSRWEKKTRLDEDKSDLDAFIDGIAQTGAPLETFLFDNVDLPTQINYMATTCITQNIDGSDKNHYLYRDTEGSGEWTMLPWDLDLTFGPDALNTDNMVASEAGTSHPWIGARPYTLNLGAGKYNHFLEVIVANPRSKAMLNRRIRTLIDEHLTSGYFHNRIDELVAQIGPDVLLDKAKWGGNTHFGGATYTLQAANDRIVNEYLTPRVPHLTITHGQAGSGTVFVPENSAVTALVPTDNSLGDSWKFAGFDDSAWLSGTGAVGYERSPLMTYTPLLGIDLLSTSIPAALRIDANGDNINDNNSCYVRYEFDVADKNAVSFLRLRMKYDDGFVAFLNGTRVAARNDPNSLTWDAEADDQNPDPDAQVFEDVDITAFKSFLLDGLNVLAVQALNFGDTSSDMLLSCELVDAAATGGGAGIPPSQPSLPTVKFGIIEFNPVSGDQDEEFIEVINCNSYDLDVSGWTLEGGVDQVLKGGTVIPAGESLYLSPNAAAFRSRGTMPTGGMGFFVQGSYSGHLSNFGEPLTLKNAAGTIMAQTTTPVDPSDAQLYLVVSEIMYHPAGDPGEEFIELQNISDSVTLDLSGVRFTAGVAFEFTGSAVTSLAPGDRVLVVRNQSAFDAIHGGGLPVAGQFADLSVLDNDGEILKLEDAANSTIQEFRYNDALPWPTAPDGLGPSLVLIAPLANPDPSLPANWRSSVLADGNPGASDATTFTGVAGADSDSNGLDDFLDYALGHAPGAHDGLPVISIGNGTLTFSYLENLAADDATVSAQWSTDLLNWQPLDENFDLQSLTPEPGGRQTVVYATNPLTFPLGERLFIRLIATQ